MRPMNVPGALFYAAMRALLGTAARAYFRRIDVRHLERFPAAGPVLVVANHPASLTDVLVLGAALPRRIHFVAYSGLFKPWVLGFVLRLCGALPVYRREDAADLMHRNDDTFRAVHELFDAGGVVLIFPEGTSLSDREVLKLKTGAARMALAHEARPGREGRLVVLPMGLHFVERTAFGSNVVLSIGKPIDLAPYRDSTGIDPQQAVRQLTDRIQEVLEKLILHVPSSDLARLVRDIEGLYLDDLRATVPGAPDLALARGIADCVEHYRRADPARLYQVWRGVSNYRRKLGALDLRDQALREQPHGAASVGEPVRLVVLGAIGLAPALLGAAVHVVPYRLSGLAGGWFAPDPTGIAFARMIAGVLVFPLTYAVLALVLHRVVGWAPPAVALALVACIPLGIISIGYFRWLRRERHRLRFVLLAATNRRLVARMRADRKRVIRLLDAARTDYLAAVNATEAVNAPEAVNTPEMEPDTR